MVIICKKYKINGDESSLHSFHSSIYITVEDCAFMPFVVSIEGKK
jgi:hypothetical protein